MKTKLTFLFIVISFSLSVQQTVVAVNTVDAGVSDQSVDKNGLSRRREAIVNMSSLTAIGDLNRLKPALESALDAGMTINEIKEILIHLYAYCGFPRSLRGIQTFITVLEERKSKGIIDTTGRSSTPIADNRSRYERGKANLEKLTGMSENGSPKGYAAFAPDIEVFLKEHLFADLFDRDLLTYAERELVTVAVSASIGGVGPMVQSHMGHSITSGITPKELLHLVELIGTNAGKEKGGEAQIILELVLMSKGLTVG